MRYEIPEENMERLEKKLKSISKKCAKYGCEFKYDRGETVVREITHSFEEDGVVRSFKEMHSFVVVDVEGIAKVNDWSFVASLEHTSAGNIISGVNDIEVPERYYHADAVCEHCKSARVRKNTFIIRNEVTGEFKQVGKSCLRDYTGGLSAEAAASLLSAIREMEEYREPMSFGTYKSWYEVSEIARFAAETIHHFGYVKRDFGSISTADRTVDFFRYFNDMHLGNVAYERCVAESEKVGFDANSEYSVSLAEKVTDWVLSNESNDNYHHNLKVVFSNKYTDFKSIGLIVSAFPAYDRNLEWEAKKKEEAEKAAGSEHVGKVGDRLSLVIKDFRCITSWESSFGWVGVFKIVGGDGNTYTWKTSVGLCPEDLGGTLKGTVKAHKEWNGEKETELTRCKVTRVEKVPSKEELEANEAAMKEIDACLDALLAG